MIKQPKSRPSQKKKINNQPLLIAHRGGIGAGVDKQNTMAAFESAVQLGCNYLETDVILSRDGQVVVDHGAQNLYMEWKSGLKRRKHLQRMTYQQILQEPGFEHTVLLRDVLVAFPGVFLSIDAKTFEVVKPLVALIKELNAEDQVLVTSFRLRRTLLAKRLLNTDQASLCLYSIAAYPLSLLPKTALGWLRNKGITHLHLPYRTINSRLIKAARKNNITIYGWTVNQSADIRKMIDLEVDGIISDDFAGAKKAISSM